MSEEEKGHPPTPPPSRPVPPGGRDGSSGFGERLARIEAKMEHVATKEDIQRLRVWVLGGVLGALSVAIMGTIGVASLFA